MKTSEFKMIEVSQREGIATITFQRAESLNAMNRQMMHEIIAALADLNASETARVIVLTGAGKAFMAGADINEYAQQTISEFESFQTLGRELYALIEGNAKPVIAAINGYAFGGGFEIALACDLIVAKAGAKCGLPEIKLELIPGGGGTQRLAAKAGLNRANDLLMTGRSATVEELQEWGLVNRIWEAEAFDHELAAFANELASKNPLALRTLKQLTRIATGSMNTAAQCLENEALARLYPSDGAQNQIQGFYQASLKRAEGKNKQS